jgi:hypothetical protein
MHFNFFILLSVNVILSTVEPHYSGPYYKGQLMQMVADVEQSAYYEHIRHLRQLLNEEISSKQTQQKINYFFKPMNVSNQHEPGPSFSKDYCSVYAHIFFNSTYVEGCFV